MGNLHVDLGGYFRLLFIVTMVENFLQNRSRSYGYYCRRCQIDGRVLLIIVRISKILSLFLARLVRINVGAKKKSFSSSKILHNTSDPYRQRETSAHV